MLDVIIFILLAVVYFFISNIFKELTPSEIDKLKVVYLIAGFFSISSFIFTPVDGVLIAYERFFVLKIADLLQKAFVIIFMVIALFMGYGLFALILINGVVGFGIKLFKF